MTDLLQRNASEPVNPFAISDERERQLVSELAAVATAINSTKQFSLHLLPPGSPASALAERVTADVFGTYFGNDPALLFDEYASYLPQSWRLIACDRLEQKVAGSLTWVVDEAQNLKTVRDLAREPWCQAADDVLTSIGISPTDRTCWDITTLAVRPEYQHTRVSIALIDAFYAASLVAHATHWIAILDTKVLRGLQLLTADIFAPINGAEVASYLGSESSAPVVALATENKKFVSRTVHCGVSGHCSIAALPPEIRQTMAWPAEDDPAVIDIRTR